MPPYDRTLILCFIACATICGCTGKTDHGTPAAVDTKRTAAKVKVVKEKATYETVQTNDSLGSDEAQTHWFFHCIPRLDHESVEEVVKPDRAQISLRVTGGELTVGLSIKHIIAKNDTPKLREHEEGHAKICESVYAGAEAAATRAIQGSIGHIFSGVGKDKAAASTNAIKNAKEFICAEFSAQTAARASELSKQYDEITAHGANAVPSRQALDQVLNARQ